MAHARSDMVRISLVVPPEERDAFERWCRYEGPPRISMTAAIREFMRLASTGRVTLDRKRAREGVRTTRKAPKPSRPK